MNFFGNDKIFIGYLLFLIFLFLFSINLRAEISIETQYSEMNVPSGRNFIYSISIKNIGLDNVNVSCSAVGINQITMSFNPPSAQIAHGNTTLINVSIITKGTLPGDYKGLVYIWNDNSHEVMERIPLNISVKQVYQPSQDQKPLPLCMKR